MQNPKKRASIIAISTASLIILNGCNNEIKIQNNKPNSQGDLAPKEITSCDSIYSKLVAMTNRHLINREISETINASSACNYGSDSVARINLINFISIANEAPEAGVDESDFQSIIPKYEQIAAECLAKYPGDRVCLIAAMVFASKNNVDIAKFDSIALQTFSRWPDEFEWATYYAESLTRNSEFKKSIKVLQTKMGRCEQSNNNEGPLCADAYINYAFNYMGLGHRDSAIKYFHLAHKLDPNFSLPIVYLAKFWAKVGKRDSTCYYDSILRYKPSAYAAEFDGICTSK